MGARRQDHRAAAPAVVRRDDVGEPERGPCDVDAADDPGGRLAAAEARGYLESLPELWAKTSDAGRHAIAEAVFERIDVLGANDFSFTLTAHAKAHGWDAAFGAGDQSISIGQSGRGERDSPATSDLPITMRLAEPPAPCDWLLSA